MAAGAAGAAAVAACGFLLFRRSQRKQVEDRSLGDRSLPSQPPMPADKWSSDPPAGKWSPDQGVAADAIDVIPLPKRLRPIATGRSSRRSPRLQQAGSAPQATQHVAAAAGDAAAAAMQQAAAAQLQQYAPDYHVVHMPSPRLTGGVGGCLVGRLHWLTPNREEEGGSQAGGCALVLPRSHACLCRQPAVSLVPLLRLGFTTTHSRSLLPCHRPGHWVTLWSAPLPAAAVTHPAATWGMVHTRPTRHCLARGAAAAAAPAPAPPAAPAGARRQCAPLSGMLLWAGQTLPHSPDAALQVSAKKFFTYMFS